VADTRPAAAATDRPSVVSGSRVIIVVSRGPIPPAVDSFVVMPDVTGGAPGSAHSALADQGFEVRSFAESGDLTRGGRVTGQQPPAGTRVPVGTQAVIITSASGRAPDVPLVPLPDVVCMHEVEAVGAVHRAGLAVETVYEYSSRSPEGIVIAQLPDPSVGVAEPRRRNVWPWVIAGVILVALLALLAAWFLSGVEVPNVVGEDRAVAEQRIESAGLRVGQVTTEDADGAEPGTVLEQTPAGGANARRGSAVALVVASEDTDVAVPNVVRMSEEEAVATLEAAGLAVDVTNAPSDAVEEGLVVRQTPGAGQVVPPGTTVGIVVSEGARVENVDVPDVTGLTSQDAERALTEAGLQVAVAESPSTAVASGVVISQLPAAGESVAPGTTIGLQVSTGPPEDDSQVEVPDVVGDSVSAAENELRDAGLQSLRVAVGGTGRPANEVVAQSPAAGDEVAENSTVVLFFSAEQ
jgi:beta-lactam-binding protein with PASTA domain